MSCSTTTLRPIEYTTELEQITDSTEQIPSTDSDMVFSDPLNPNAVLTSNEITELDFPSQPNFIFPIRNGTRQQRIHVFRPLFVYRQEQIKKNRVKPTPKPKPTKTPTTPAPTYNPDRYGSAYPFYGSYYPSYTNYPSIPWSNYYSSYYYPNYYNTYGYPSSSSDVPSSGFYLPPVVSPVYQYQRPLVLPSTNLEAPLPSPTFHWSPLPAPYPANYPSYPNYPLSYWRK